MPKKFSGENSKSAAARARKDAAKQEIAAKKKQAEEDAYWNDDDKTVVRKLQRKEEAERKRQEALQRKVANRTAHDSEMEQLSGRSAAPAKVTQAAIETMRAEAKRREEEERRQRMLEEARVKELETEEIEENINLLQVEGEVARSVSEAISVLSDDTQLLDRHPEKRLKAAYSAFEQKTLPRLKQEHPTFRLSQLKQVLKKEWQKSPENPLNQKILNIIQ